MASNLLGMASNLRAMAPNLIAMASNLLLVRLQALASGTVSFFDCLRSLFEERREESKDNRSVRANLTCQ